MDDLDARLRAAAPVTADFDNPRMQHILAVLPERLRAAVGPGADRRPTPRRWAWRRTVGVALAAALVLAAPVTAARVISAHTGWFGQGGEEGTGEFIRLDSPEFARVLEQIRRSENLPLPPGAGWSDLRSRFEVSQPSVETTSGIASGVESYARCAWQAAFVRASRAGDRALQRRAAAVIAAIPNWPQMSRESDDFRAVLAAQARAAAAGHPGDAHARGYDPGNIAADFRVNCTDVAVGQ